MNYPFDPTGTSAKNRIVNERFYISPGRELEEASLLIPKCKPFFKENFELWTGINSTGNQLVLGEDYVFIDANEILGNLIDKDIYYAIWINNKFLTKTLYANYNTLGGHHVFNSEGAITKITSMLTNSFKFSWNDIVGKPTTFKPRKHIHDPTESPMSEFVSFLRTTADEIIEVIPKE